MLGIGGLMRVEKRVTAQYVGGDRPIDARTDMAAEYLEFFPEWVREAEEPRPETHWWQWRGMRIRLLR